MSRAEQFSLANARFHMRSIWPTDLIVT